MEVLTFNHLSFKGNPLAAAVAVEAVKVLKEEKMVENSEKMGQRLLAGL